MGGQELLKLFNTRKLGVSDVDSKALAALKTAVDGEADPKKSKSVLRWNGAYWMEGVANWVSDRALFFPRLHCKYRRSQLSKLYSQLRKTRRRRSYGITGISNS